MVENMNGIICSLHVLHSRVISVVKHHSSIVLLSLLFFCSSLVQLVIQTLERPIYWRMRKTWTFPILWKPPNLHRLEKYGNITLYRTEVQLIWNYANLVQPSHHFFVHRKWILVPLYSMVFLLLQFAAWHEICTRDL